MKTTESDYNLNFSTIGFEPWLITTAGNSVRARNAASHERVSDAIESIYFILLVEFQVDTSSSSTSVQREMEVESERVVVLKVKARKVLAELCDTMSLLLPKVSQSVSQLINESVLDLLFITFLYIITILILIKYFISVQINLLFVSYMLIYT